jgi:hypothetical protein
MLTVFVNLDTPQGLTLAPTSNPMSDNGSLTLTARPHNGLGRCVAFSFISIIPR